MQRKNPFQKNNPIIVIIFLILLTGVLLAGIPLFVQKMTLQPDPLRFDIWNYSNDSHKVEVKVFDNNNILIFNETYFVNASEGKYSPTIIKSPTITSKLGSYKYVITLDDEFTAEQSVEVRYEMTTSSSDYLSIDIHDDKENPLHLGISIA